METTIMQYGFSKTSELSYEQAIGKVTDELKKEGFGVLTTIDVKDTLKKKIDVDFKKYVILGACNPPFAYKALQEENKIGTMLPCNVIVRETGNGTVEIAAVDPVASMKAVENSKLGGVAVQVQTKLKKVIQNLK